MNHWTDICNINDILPNMGRCALFQGEQVAIFRIQEHTAEKFYAIHNLCPFSKANIISRGIIGSMANQTVVASPLYKQHFDLNTGMCIEDSEVVIKTYEVRIENGKVQLAA